MYIIHVAVRIEGERERERRVQRQIKLKKSGTHIFCWSPLTGQQQPKDGKRERERELIKSRWFILCSPLLVSSLMVEE